MDILTIVILALVLWCLYKNGYFGNLLEGYLADSLPALARIFPSKNLTGSARNITKTGASASSLLPFVAQSLTVKKGYKLVLFTQTGQKGDSVTFIDDVQDLSLVPTFKAVGNKIGSYLVDTLKNKGALDYPKYSSADSSGGDIKCFQTGETAGVCRALCADDPNCIAYNYVSPGYGGAWAKGGCCLKFNANNLSAPNAVKNIDWYSNIAPADRPTINGEAANDLGADNSNVWGANVFITKDAKWIWNTPTAVTSAPAYDVLKFSNNFWNGVAPMAATLHLIVDNVADVYQNGKVIQQNVGGGWNTTNYPKIPVNLVTGNNLIEILASNWGAGPAGLKIALVRNSDNAILLKSDSTWKVSTAMGHTSMATAWGPEGNTFQLQNHDVACPTGTALSGFRFVRKGDGNFHEEYDCMNSSKFGASSSFATPLNDAGNGNSVYLDRHNVDCGTNKVLNEWKLVSPASNQMQIQYKCMDSPGQKDCENLTTPLNYDGGGNIIYLDRHNVMCPPGKVLTGHKLVRNGSNYQYQYKCCGVPTIS